MYEQPDIVLFMSDQHGGDYVSWHGMQHPDTPNLEKMKVNGVNFDACYSSCPICVPSRMSFMSSLLPSKTGIFSNEDTLPDMTPCFTHALVAAGYETVLAGRMHFIGQNQRHGFTKRIAPDITPITWGRNIEKLKEMRGRTSTTFFDLGATELAGGGKSVVAYYDQMVVEAALQYLRQPHDQPQFLLIGTYGPHFPYITDKEMYQKYIGKVQIPYGFQKEEIPAYVLQNPILNSRIKKDVLKEKDALSCLAAYFGQIEIMDAQLGRIREAATAAAKRDQRQLIFGYLSDHGDTCGEYRQYGKRSYFDTSSKVPLLLEGEFIAKNQTISSPVSLMDVGPTICSMAGTSFEIADGQSLFDLLETHQNPQTDRVIVSQMVDKTHTGMAASVMLRWKNYKYIHYHTDPEQVILIDLAEDSLEKNDIASTHPELIHWFSLQEKASTDFTSMENLQKEHERNRQWFKKYETVTGRNETDWWQDVHTDARGDLEITGVDRMDEFMAEFKMHQW